LTDYKVVVLAVDEGIVAENVQNRLAEGSELKLDDATKIVGCYKALAKVGFNDKNKNQDLIELKPMRRALAFCQNIALSKLFADEFAKVVSEYISNEALKDQKKNTLSVEIHHVDGTFNAEQRNEELNWLKNDSDENSCRVLTNARCLSEGVDVPSLDAIMFLHPRKSQIDVVQSVGRVMRKFEGKDLGYVILPITVAPGVSAEKTLNDNEKYKVVWQILNALRAHDERFDSTINRIGLGEDVSDRIEIVGVGDREELDATTAVVDDIKPKKRDKNEPTDDAAELGDQVSEDSDEETNGEQLAFVMSDLTQAIRAKIVEKCGTRDYWENWASDIAKIAQTHIIRIQKIVFNQGTPERAAFNRFLEEIRDDLNPEISETDAVEMLAQHLITRPVFDTLFQGNKFTVENSVSKAMETVLSQLDKHNIEKETDILEKFYTSVKRRAADITTATGRQTLVLELYDRFFRNAFPTLTKRLGIVYTPIEVVDFIIHSVNDVLQDEFGKRVGNENVHILDPFAGTATFITRLMQSGLISPDELPYKYRNEMHANEIVLLAFYIAAINIEAVYQDLAKENQYQPFNGIVLTDTFQLFEQDRDLIANLLPDNSNRRTAQKTHPITVIVANPPYSAGQKSENDSAANVSYPNLDYRIESTYALASTATLKTALYDSYIRAFRWASDRLGDEGVIGFVTNAGWIDGNATDGMRKHLHEEFSKIYVFHLRGNQRTSGELSRKEGGKVFGSGSRAPIAITILVKNTQSKEQGKIFFHDVGDYLTREQKLSILKHYKSIRGISDEKKWVSLKPDTNNDWINQGEKEFSKFISLGDKKDKNSIVVFNTYSGGIKTNRDAWMYNFSKKKIINNMRSTVESYNNTVSSGKNYQNAEKDPRKISWSSGLARKLEKRVKALVYENNLILSSYRPFTKMFLYYDPMFIERMGQMRSIFLEGKDDNLAIVVSGIGSVSFSALMIGEACSYDIVAKSQCFPMKVYGGGNQDEGLFGYGADDCAVTHGITDEGIQHFVKTYPHEQISKDDLFYYIYGFLHSPDYRTKFENNLSKELPRIPAVRRYEDFKLFSNAGRELADLHVNYESVLPYPVTYKQGDLRLANISDPKSFYRVHKMKFGATGGKTDKSTVIYNHNITMTNIPLEAYEYVVNGKPALEWVMERQSIKTDKESGIVNDANDYANESMNNPAYPLVVFQRVITVALETMKIVKALPAMDLD
jgi:predicted helicase